jgi:hypothetical protein
MAKQKNEINSSSLLSFLETGGTQKEAAVAFQVSLPTIQKRIAELQMSKETLEIYKTMQPYHITALQAEVLENITKDKIENADLEVLLKAITVLKKIEMASEHNKQREKVTGLVAYLLELERRDREGIDVTPVDGVLDCVSTKLDCAVQEILSESTDEIEDEEEGLLDALP